MSIYEVMWFCIVGSFLGYILETLWYRKLRGKWICRKGVIYGLYSPIYGIALALFAKIFWKIKSNWLVFIYGCIIGSLFEYLCGFLQEKILHTKSWDYSKKPFQIKGRICLEFAIYWGIIALTVVNIIGPILHSVYIGLFNEVFKYIIIILFIGLVVDCIISGLACLQQKNRREGSLVQNKMTQFLDKHYSDERLAKVYTEIRFL